MTNLSCIGAAQRSCSDPTLSCMSKLFVGAVTASAVALSILTAMHLFLPYTFFGACFLGYVSITSIVVTAIYYLNRKELPSKEPKGKEPEIRTEPVEPDDIRIRPVEIHPEIVVGLSNIAAPSFGEFPLKLPSIGRYDTKGYDFYHPQMGAKLPSHFLSAFPSKIQAELDGKNPELFILVYTASHVKGNYNLILHPIVFSAYNEFKADNPSGQIWSKVGIFEPIGIQAAKTNGRALILDDFKRFDVFVHPDTQYPDATCISPNNMHFCLDDHSSASFYAAATWEGRAIAFHAIILRKGDPLAEIQDLKQFVNAVNESKLPFRNQVIKTLTKRPRSTARFSAMHGDFRPTTN